MDSSMSVCVMFFPTGVGNLHDQCYYSATIETLCFHCCIAIGLEFALLEQLHNRMHGHCWNTKLCNNDL
jgi:hypothetical protein